MYGMETFYYSVYSYLFKLRKAYGDSLFPWFSLDMTENDIQKNAGMQVLIYLAF